MTLAEIRAAIVADFAALAGMESIHVAGWDGRFSAEDLRSWAPRAPAVMVGVTRVANLKPQGDHLWGDCAFVAAVIVNDGAGKPRDMRVLELVGLLIERVEATERKPWAGLSEFGDVIEADKVQASNLASMQLDRKGLTLWAVTWNQRVKVAPVRIFE